MRGAEGSRKRSKRQVSLRQKLSPPHNLLYFEMHVVAVKMINYLKNLQSSENYALNHAENIVSTFPRASRLCECRPECKVILKFIAVIAGAVYGRVRERGLWRWGRRHSALRVIGHQQFYRSHEQSLAFYNATSASFSFVFIYILLVTFLAQRRL